LRSRCSRAQCSSWVARLASFCSRSLHASLSRPWIFPDARGPRQVRIQSGTYSSGTPFLRSGSKQQFQMVRQKEARKPRGKPHFPALRLGYTSSCHDLVPHPARPMSALPVCRRPRSICGPSGCPVHEIDGHVGKREVAAKSTKCQRVYTPGA